MRVAVQLPDRGEVRRLAARAAEAYGCALEGLPDEWMYHMMLGKMRAKSRERRLLPPCLPSAPPRHEWPSDIPSPMQPLSSTEKPLYYFWPSNIQPIVSGFASISRSTFEGMGSAPIHHHK